MKIFAIVFPRKMACALLVLAMLVPAGFISNVPPFRANEAHAAIQATYYASPSGSGSTCSLGSPCSITGARDKVRTVNSSMTGDIIVYLLPGDYNVTSTIAFNQSDSGTNGYTIYYKNYGALGSARLIGGQAVTGWTVHAGNIYKANVGTTWEFHDLFENGRRAVKARTPNINSDYGLTTSSQGPWFKNEEIDPPIANNKTVFQYQTGDLNPTGWVLSGMQAHIFSGGYFNWINNVSPITSIDPVSRRITLSQNTLYELNDPQSRYFIQGDISLLDAPGEFFLDHAAGYLYYYPRSTPIANQTIIAPKVKDIIRFEGASEGSLVKNIQIEGLTLEVSDYTDRDPAPKLLYTQENSMIFMKNAEYITIKNCHLKNAGLSGILMRYYNKNHTLYGNWIEQSGMSAISIVGYYSAEAGRSNVTRDHVIHNNKTEFFGMHNSESGGVYIDYSGHNNVAHNWISTGPRYLIGSGGDHNVSEADNYVENNYFGYNELYRGGEDTADIGAFYFVGTVHQAEASTVEQIKIDTAFWNANADLSQVYSWGPFGIYLDDQSDWWTVSNAYVTNIMEDRFHTHNSENHTVTNGSWMETFDESLMDFKNIGLKPDFPAAYGNGGWVWASDNDGGFSYSGSWSYRNDAPVADNLAGDEHFTNTATDYAEFKFSGTEVKWAASTSGNRGKADVYIDGVFDETVDLYTGTSVRQNVVYHKKGLKDGQHKIKIIARNDKNASSGGYYVTVDGIGAASTYVNDKSFTYSGSWTTGTYAGDYEGDETYSNTAGNYAQYTFTGTEVQWLSATTHDSGKADVYIDGVLDATVDQYTPSIVRQNAVYSKRGLTPGPHTIRIQARNDKNPSSTGYYTVIDAIVYKPDQPANYANDTAFTTTGSWSYRNDAPVADNFNGDETYSNTPTAYAEYTFTGTEVKWLAATSDNRGKADVYIDGVLDATVDLYTAATSRQNIVYSKTGLSNASHTIKIQVRSDKNASSGGYYITIDALQYK